MDGRVNAPAVDARRALVLHDRALVIDLITLTLNHGVFAVRAASSFAEAETILHEWGPQLAVVDMYHDDNTTFLAGSTPRTPCARWTTEAPARTTRLTTPPASSRACSTCSRAGPGAS